MALNHLIYHSIIHQRPNPIHWLEWTMVAADMKWIPSSCIGHFLGFSDVQIQILFLCESNSCHTSLFWRDFFSFLVEIWIFILGELEKSGEWQRQGKIESETEGASLSLSLSLSLCLINNLYGFGNLWKKHKHWNNPSRKWRKRERERERPQSTITAKNRIEIQWEGNFSAGRTAAASAPIPQLS